MNKPAHGEPCNGCGLCCQLEICHIGVALFHHSEGPCPALQPAGDGRWECGAITTPGAFRLARTLEVGEEVMSGAAAFLLGAEQGCDCTVEDEEINFAFELEMLMASDTDLLLAARAQMLWGMIE